MLRHPCRTFLEHFLIVADFPIDRLADFDDETSSSIQSTSKLFYPFAMARPVTLFTGQWADLPLKDLAALAKKMGFDGLELACWGDHFDVSAAAESKDYCKERWQILSENGLTAFSISNHLFAPPISALTNNPPKPILPPLF